MKTLFIILTMIIGLILSSSHDLSLKLNRVNKVVIDAGHGGKDPGCLGKNTQEKNIAYDISRQIGDLIKLHLEDVEVIYTRDKNKFVELKERARKANRENANFFISIHCNAHAKSEIIGSETYVMGLSSEDDNLEVAMRENAVILAEEEYENNYRNFDPNSPIAHIILANFQSSYQKNSLNMAHKIESQFSKKLNRPSRGVKQSGFLVLAKTAMPSVLVEVGFLTNEKDEKYLNSKKGKSYISASIYRAFRDYKKEIERYEF